MWHSDGNVSSCTMGHSDDNVSHVLCDSDDNVSHALCDIVIIMFHMHYMT